MLFLVLDVETIFLCPLAAVYRKLNMGPQQSPAEQTLLGLGAV